MKKILEDIGFSKSEVKIYLFLQKGPNSVGEISKATLIHRRNIYDILENLIEKGFISYIKENNIKIYSLTNPKRILDKIEQRKNKFESILPNLLSSYKNTQSKNETLFFRGIEGLKQIFDNQIETGEEILINATSTNVGDILKYFFAKHNRERKEKNIKIKMIIDESSKKNKKALKEIKSIPLTTIKFVSEFNKSPMSQYIYGENVAIVVWSELPIAILIKQKEIAHGFRDNFEIMWKIAK